MEPPRVELRQARGWIEVRRPRHVRRLGWGAFAAFATASVLGPVASTVAHGAALSAAFLTAFLAAPALSLAALVVGARGRARRATLTVVARGLHIARARGLEVIAPDALVAGWVVPTDRTDGVAFELRDGRILSATLEPGADAGALLSAAGLEASRRRMVLSIGSALDAVSAWFWTMVLGSIVIVPLVGAFAGVPLLGRAAAQVGIALDVALAVWAAVSFLPGRVVVGADGVALRYGWQREFVPYAQLQRVRHEIGTVRLELANGSSLRVPGANRTEDELRALAARIREAARPAGPPAEPAALAALERGARPLGAWRHALRALADGTAGYRTVSVSRESLARVVEDSRAPIERRIGAALALRDCGDPGARASIGAAIDACACEPLRHALVLLLRAPVSDVALERAVSRCLADA